MTESVPEGSTLANLPANGNPASVRILSSCLCFVILSIYPDFAETQNPVRIFPRQVSSECVRPNPYHRFILTLL